MGADYRERSRRSSVFLISRPAISASHRTPKKIPRPSSTSPAVSTVTPSQAGHLDDGRRAAGDGGLRLARKARDQAQAARHDRSDGDAEDDVPDQIVHGSDSFHAFNIGVRVQSFRKERGSRRKERVKPYLCPSSARLSLSTFTRGSPRKPSWRPSVAAATSALTFRGSRPRAFATRAAWYSAAARLMCGSSPLPEAVTRSAGTGAVLPGSASRSAFTRAVTASVNAGMVRPWFRPPEELAL